MSTRLWFRVEDVLPLAEHALACTTHRLTRAQLAAGEHNTPALTLARTGPLGALRSNGVPVWHTDQGEEQVAFAYSWRPATGSHVEPEEHLYLPLGQAGPGGRRLIDLLRAGRDLDRNWIAVDTDTWPGPMLNATHVEVLDHRADIAPPGMRWRPAMVTSPQAADKSYPALVADGYTAGEASLICRFDPHTARQIAADLTGSWRAGTMPGEYPLLRFDGTTAVLLEEHEIGGETRLDVDDRHHPDRDGYYSIGAYRWFWHAAGTTSIPIRARLRLHLTTLAARFREVTATRRPSRQASAAPGEPPF